MYIRWRPAQWPFLFELRVFDKNWKLVRRGFFKSSEDVEAAIAELKQD